MKKILCGALALLTLSAAFVGCKKDKDETNATEITLSVSSIKMASTTYDSSEGIDVPNTIRFTITPKDLTYTITASEEGVVTWTISKNVVTLTAQKIGTTELTIASTSTTSTAVLPVQVVSEIESLSFTQATVSYYNGADYLATLDTVDSVFSYVGDDNKTHYLRAFLVDATVELFSDGLYINDDQDMAGAEVGYVANFPAKAFYAPEGMNDDRGFTGAAAVSTGLWSTQTSAKSHAMKGGYLDVDSEEAAMDHIKAAINYWNAYQTGGTEEDLKNFQLEMALADTTAFKGAKLIKYTYSAYFNDYSMTFMPAGIVNAGLLQMAYNEASMYMYSVPAAEMYINVVNGDYGWGVYVEQNEISKEITLLSTNFEVEKNSIHYKHIDSAESAPARMGVNQFDKAVRTFAVPRNVRMR